MKLIMSSYKFKIKDYHAIKSADVDLDGITVLAGVNGSGKSTVSKWLYYVVDGALNFDKYAFGVYYTSVETYLERLFRAYREIKGLPSVGRKETINTGYTAFLDFLDFPIDDSGYVDKFHNIIDVMSNDLQKYIDNHKSPDHNNFRISRIKRYLDIPEDIMDGVDVGKYFITAANAYLDDQIKQYHTMLDNRDKEDFYGFIHDKFNETDSVPSKMWFYEDGVNMLAGKSLGRILNIERVIYIDSPVVFRGSSSVSPFWRKLNDLLKTKSSSSSSTRQLLLRIRRVLKGRFKLVENKITDENELHYQRADGLDIAIDKTATGFRSFAYLQMLLENGYLDENTILLIDEPEAHLHPQWIVEYANIVVHLYKELGVKIMLASHNPDMVSAIYNISRKEGVADDVNYYLSEPDKQEFMFNFVNQNGEISNIFKSFNIALDRINLYGGINETNNL
jgi:predicted ATPase/succinate dehydrogenase flavin-adding protein (antitoxin of CptAB toxin-antitoxin module)